MRLTNRKKFGGCGLLCAHYTRSLVESACEDGASCQLRYSITKDSNTHARFAVALSAPEVGLIGHVPREFSRVVRHFLLHGGTLTCKVSGRRQRGKGLEVPCLNTCPRCAAVDRTRYRAIFFDQKRMRLTSSTKDRKKGCAYDPGALMIQGALQNQTLRYIGTKLHIYMCVDQYCTGCSCVTGSFSGLEQSRAVAVCLCCESWHR